MRRWGVSLRARHGVSLVVVALAALASPAVHAERIFGREVTPRAPLDADEIAARRAALQEHLETQDLVQDGDVIRPRVPQVPAQLRDRVRDTAAPWDEPPHYATIYLNFFGGTLGSGTNAAEMQAGCVGPVDIDYPAFAGTNSSAMSMVQVFQSAMEPYAVRIAYESPPPAHLPYSMVMMGGDPTDIGMDPGILGVSCSSDCGDVWWRDTTFAFTEASSSALTLGNTALQEAAHAFGLDHIDGSEHIMYPFASGGQKIWSSACTPYNDATGGISCTYVHDAFCGDDSGMQNDDAELLAFFGPNAPDVTAPEVTITEPADGSELPAGADVAVAAEVTDDHEGAGWRLVVTPEGADPLISNAYQFETSWQLADLPQGTYVIRVEAIDHDRNEGADEVTIYVGTDAPADSTASGGGSASSSGGSSGESGDDPTGDDGTGGGTPQTGDDEGGCACTVRTTARDVAPLALLGTVLLVGRRRRVA